MRSLFTNVEEHIKFENHQENQISDFIEEIREQYFNDPNKKLKPLLIEDQHYNMDNNVRRFRLTFEGYKPTDEYLVYIKF